MCGYDLRAAASDRCSECGAVVGRGVSSRIPWAMRGWRGRADSYVRTLVAVCFRRGLLLEEARHRMSRRDARSFFQVTLLLAVVLMS
jgi:hypothetical protein